MGRDVAMRVRVRPGAKGLRAVAFSGVARQSEHPLRLWSLPPIGAWWGAPVNFP